LDTELPLNVYVGRADEVGKCCCIGFAARIQFHVPHTFATSLQETSGVAEHRAVKEADIDVTFECVDVPKGRILYTCDGTTIVHQLSDIVTAPPHLRKPLLRNRLQLDPAPLDQPYVDRGISFYASRQPQDLIHTGQPAQIQRNAMGFTHSDEIGRRVNAVPRSEAALIRSSLERIIGHIN